MDSISQIALGASIGVAVMGRRAPVWRAALWGGLAGTLPDLDVVIDYGDPIRNMTLHRAETHALFWLTLFAPVWAGLVSMVQRDAQYRWWLLAMWLALVTHPLLDSMTVYGTQLALPFTQHPYGVASIFIIDPLYTLPLLLGLLVAFWRGRAGGGTVTGGALGAGGTARATDAVGRARAVARVAPAGGPARRAVLWGLALSTAYLGWSAGAQAHVQRLAQRSLADAGITVERLLVTPAPLNTVLWRVLAMTPDGYAEGFHSLLDTPGPIRFERFDNPRTLATRHADDWHVARIAWFSHGFFSIDETPSGVRIRDLRMGFEPAYSFGFGIDAPGAAGATAIRALGERPDVGRALPWLGRRMLGEALASPR